MFRRCWCIAGRGGKAGAAAAFRRRAWRIRRGKTLLVLDTVSDDAERLYARQGGSAAGVIPDHAPLPDGRTVRDSVFHKFLGDSEV